MVGAESQRLSRRKTIAFSSLVVLVFLALLAGIGEVAVRYRERHRDTVPGTMPFLFYRHARLGYALVRGSDYFGWVRIDSTGFRRGLSQRGQAGAIRILADGGSTTFDGSAGPDSLAWPARLQYWLNQTGVPHPVEVANAGVPGYRVVHNLIRLQTELYTYEPDLIILLQGHNDLFEALAGGGPDTTGAAFTPRPDAVKPMSQPRAWLMRNSLLFAKVQDRLNVLAFHRRSVRRHTEVAGRQDVFAGRLERGQERFERDIRLYLSAAKSLGIPVVLVPAVHVASSSDSVVSGSVAAAWRVAVPFAPTEVVLEGYRRYNAILRRAATEAGAFFIDADSFEINGGRYYAEGDPIHFNAVGSDAMARQLANALHARGLVARRVPRPGGHRADSQSASASPHESVR